MRVWGRLFNERLMKEEVGNEEWRERREEEEEEEERKSTTM